MQAQNTSERKKSKKGRQYSTPPACSKASGLGIAKEFINLLLDHDVSSLRSSTTASYAVNRTSSHSDNYVRCPVFLLPSLQSNSLLSRVELGGNSSDSLTTTFETR